MISEPPRSDLALPIVLTVTSMRWPGLAKAGKSAVMSTAAGLYLGWHVARVMSSLWVHVGLCLYFGVVVPLVWRGRDQEGYSSMAWLLCDASLVVSQALVAAYPALLEALF